MKPITIDTTISEEIGALYTKGISILDIAKKYKISFWTCRKDLKKRGIVRSASESLRISERASTGHRIQSLNETFFDQIDTEAKAYWLGFLAADGAVGRNSHSSMIYLTLHQKDKKHIENFRKSIGSSHPLHDKMSGYGTPMTQISFRSKKMVADLKKHNIVPNKSLILTPSKNIPDHLLRHYWRGVVDGDGTVCCTNRGCWIVGLCGSKEMCEGFRKFIAQFVKSRANVNPHKSIFDIKYGGNKLAKTVMKILYEDSTVFLERKMKLVKEAMS